MGSSKREGHDYLRLLAMTTDKTLERATDENLHMLMFEEAAFAAFEAIEAMGITVKLCEEMYDSEISLMAQAMIPHSGLDATRSFCSLLMGEDLVEKVRDCINEAKRQEVISDHGTMLLDCYPEPDDCRASILMAMLSVNAEASARWLRTFSYESGLVVSLVGEVNES